MRPISWCALILFAHVLTGCATSMETVRGAAVERAAFDLDCAASSLDATKLGETTRIGVTPKTPGLERSVIGVVGCEKKAVYVVECTMGACNAQLNADVKSSP